MKLKKFIRPDLRRILIFIILFILLFYSEIIRPIPQCLVGNICTKYCLTGIPEELPQNNPSPLGKYATDTSACCCYINILGLYNASPLSYWIGYLIFFYFLSCFIVLIYNKLSKKKK